MSQILFTHSYFYRFDPKQWKTAQPYPPYGTLCAAATMRACGFSVALFDTGLSPGPEGLKPALEQERPRYLVLYDDGFNYLTKMCLTRMREAAFEMIRTGKNAGCTVIVNSSDSTDHSGDYLDSGADYIIQGEGELTLRDLIMRIESGTHAGIPRVISPLEPTRDLDALPDPAWDLADISAYRAVWMKKHGYFSLNIATTRGCPFKCNWCAKPIYGNRYNSRSPERVAAEIEMLAERYGVRHFWMADDIFGLKPGWAQRFRDVVLEKKLAFSYKIQSRADLLLKEDTIEALAESGLKQVWIGAESGSQKILDAMDKGIKVDEIRAATSLLKKKGVEVCFFLQFGYLGETLEDIRATLRLVDELRPHDIGVSVSYPLPGTRFHEKVRDMLGQKQNWVVSDDLDMMYPATFSPAFYRRLHRLVHKRFRLRQGLAEWARLLSGQKPKWRRALKIFWYAPAALLDAFRLKLLEKPNPHALGI
jgi:radical SAM superfamily enzyme YgiQ (UPF0313 family)